MLTLAFLIFLLVASLNLERLVFLKGEWVVLLPADRETGLQIKGV